VRRAERLDRLQLVAGQMRCESCAVARPERSVVEYVYRSRANLQSKRFHRDEVHQKVRRPDLTQHRDRARRVEPDRGRCENVRALVRETSAVQTIAKVIQHEGAGVGELPGLASHDRDPKRWSYFSFTSFCQTESRTYRPCTSPNPPSRQPPFKT